ncbi:hypothetical protein ACLJK8_22290 [Amaricoccus sp. W119]
MRDIEAVMFGERADRTPAHEFEMYQQPVLGRGLADRREAVDEQDPCNPCRR